MPGAGRPSRPAVKIAAPKNIALAMTRAPYSTRRSGNEYVGTDGDRPRYHATRQNITTPITSAP